MAVDESILNTTKATLGLRADYTPFDNDIILHVNSVLDTLNQLGIGPEEGFMISDASATWSHFFDDVRMNSIKTYVYLRVRMLFDPPAQSHLATAFSEQIKELEWRLNVRREDDEWIPQVPAQPITP